MNKKRLLEDPAPDDVVDERLDPLGEHRACTDCEETGTSLRGERPFVFFFGPDGVFGIGE